MSANTVASANINIRVDGNVKNQAQDLFASMGLDMTTAINIFLRQSIQKKAIPFELVAVETHQTTREFGRYQSKMGEANDHDWFEPLEDFEEYM